MGNAKHAKIIPRPKRQAPPLLHSECLFPVNLFQTSPSASSCSVFLPSCLLVPCSCSNHHFLLSLFNHPPPQLLLYSIASTAAMASRWSHPCHASHTCSFMEAIPHFRKISSAPLQGDIKYPLVLLIKAIIINTKVGLQKEGVYNTALIFFFLTKFFNILIKENKNSIVVLTFCFIKFLFI